MKNLRLGEKVPPPSGLPVAISGRGCRPPLRRRNSPATARGGSAGKEKTAPARHSAATASTSNVPRTSGAKRNVTTHLLCAGAPCRSTPMRLRLPAAPNYFVASWGQAPAAAEKLNAFNPRAIHAALHKLASEEPGLFDTVIVQKYPSTHCVTFIDTVYRPIEGGKNVPLTGANV